MSTYWPIVLTGALGIIGTLAGSLGGLLVGRRQTTDQARVEHGQWLRGQRQEAYLNLITAWDQATAALDRIVDHWDDLEHALDTHGEIHEFPEQIFNRASEAQDLVLQPIEQVGLLGPEQVDVVIKRMSMAFAGSMSWLVQMASPSSSAAWGSDWMNRRGRLDEVRQEFMTAARNELRRAPQPQRGP
jgi:hypothetical protein